VAESFSKILMIQTAFIGDAILTLPLIQSLKMKYPHSSIDVTVVPRTAELFEHHPAISKIVPYDKRGKDKGLKGLWRLRTLLNEQNYDLILVPHRSLRSALLTWLLRPKLSIGFDRSAGRWIFKKTVRYDPSIHEIERNLSLLNPLNIPDVTITLPRLYPSDQDVITVDSMFHEFGLHRYKSIGAVAPGTIWNTKRWPANRFASVCEQLASDKIALVLIGGKEDRELCEEVKALAQSKNIYSLAGRLSLLQSAEMIRRCKVLLSNDSAPMHLAVAVGTPVIAIFGATIPGYGFAPRGPHDVVVETLGLKCRPCSIHGGNKCPIMTFDCMVAIHPEMVVQKVKLFL
jgi:heptosyltransferase-2